MAASRSKIGGNKYHGDWSRKKRLETRSGANLNLEKFNSSLRNINARGRRAGRKGGHGIIIEANIEELSSIFDLAGNSGAKFTKSPQYIDALNKIGAKWLKKSRGLLRKTSKNNAAQTGHLSKSLYYAIEPGALKDNSPMEEQVFLDVQPGSRAVKYFRQREYGGTIRAKDDRIATPFKGAKYFNKVRAWRSGASALSVKEILTRLNFKSTYMKKSKRPGAPWIMFGIEAADDLDSASVPVFAFHRKVRQKKYPNGRFVNPAKRDLQSKGYPARMIRRAWKKFVKKQIKKGKA